MDKTLTLDTPRSLTSNQVKDFWLLGGLSILVWALLLCLEPLKGSADIISNRFLQLPILFAWLSVFFNFPHFLISYRFGYTRGLKFVFKHWFALLFIPLFLIMFFAVGYFFFASDISGNSLILAINNLITMSGLTYQLGHSINLGTEILSLSVRIMYVTVGWHYSKQVFGCMMVYGHYTSYRFTSKQKLLLKLSLFSVAFFNFFNLSVSRSTTESSNYFFNIPITELGFSGLFVTFFQILTLILFVATCYFIFYKKYSESKKFPSLNIVIPYLAFHIWWIPPIRQNEFYFLIVPFFHSLQYLPFAYRLEVKRGARSERESLKLSLKIAALIIVGLLAFEIIPTFLDKTLESYAHFNTWYFMISFAVFINIHHFFIDSAIWKFDDPKVKEKLLGS